MQKPEGGPRSKSEVFAGRPGLRDSAADHPAELEDELVFAPTFPVRVLHFPVRSAAQYRHRVELTDKAGLLESKNREDLRTAYETGTLDDVYASLILDDEAVAKGIEEGALVEDTDFRDYLAACPDPLEGGDLTPPARAPGRSSAASASFASLNSTECARSPDTFGAVGEETSRWIAAGG